MEFNASGLCLFYTVVMITGRSYFIYCESLEGNDLVSLVIEGESSLVVVTS